MDQLPLAIMLALAESDNYRYGLWRQINQEQPVRFAASQRSFYRYIDALTKSGKIEIIAGTQPSRYHLSPFGRRLLKAELAQLRVVVDLLHERIN